VNTLVNADCVWEHFLRQQVRPRVNQLRILAAMLLYTLPIMGWDAALFGQIWLVFAIACYFFAAYPIGGWSHAVFHLVIALAAPLLMQAGTMVAQEDVQRGVWCIEQQQQQQ